MNIVEAFKPGQEMKKAKFIFSPEQYMEGTCRGVLFYIDIKGTATVIIRSRANKNRKWLKVARYTESGVYNIKHPLFETKVIVKSDDKDAEVTVDAIPYS